LRTHTWLTIFRPTKAGLLVHGARYTAWPVARALGRRAQAAVKQVADVSRARLSSLRARFGASPCGQLGKRAGGRKEP
jgi:hypothetical protein